MKPFEVQPTSKLERILRRIDSADYRANRRVREQGMLLDYAFMVGQQWLVNGEYGAVPAVIGAKEKKQRHTANKILGKAYRAQSKVLQVNAQYVVVPNRPTYEARSAAKLATLLRQHLWRSLKLDAVEASVLWWACVVGDGIFGTFWDPEAGIAERTYFHEDRDWPNMEAIANPELRHKLEAAGRYKDAKVGEIRCEACDPFATHPDPDAKQGIASGRFAWREYAMHVDAIFDQFGVRVEPDAQAVEGAEHLKRALAWTNDAARTTLLGVNPDLREHARVVEWFEVPSREEPKGLHLIAAGHKELRGGANKYAAWGCPIPMASMQWFPKEGGPHGMSLVGTMRGSQLALNESRTVMREHAKRWCFPPILTPKGSGITPVKINNNSIPWPVWEFNASLGSAVFGQAPQLPQAIVADIATSDAEMASIAAQSDPTNGSQYPSQVRSGPAIGLIQADNNLILSPTLKQFLAMKQSACTSMLQIAQACYTTERMIQVFGRGSDFEVKYLTGADLRGQTQVTVIVGPNPLESIETRQERAMRALELQFFNPANPEHQVLLMKTFAFGDDSEIVASITQDDEAEEREIARMLEDESYLPAPQPWMRAEVRVKTLERYMNSRAFEQLDEKSLARSKIVARWQTWTEILAARMKQAMEYQAMAGGGAAPKGTPSPPRR